MLDPWDEDVRGLVARQDLLHAMQLAMTRQPHHRDTTDVTFSTSGHISYYWSIVKYDIDVKMYTHLLCFYHTYFASTSCIVKWHLACPLHGHLI